MPEPWETLKLLADPTRLRLLSLLRREELSVAELQEVLGMGQSRISSHLALLRQGELVSDRKEGKRSFYGPNRRLDETSEQLIESALATISDAKGEFHEDRVGLDRILERRRRASEQYFNTVAGRLGKNYCPGRSWEAIGHLLLHLVPKITVVDLGAGEGVLSQLMARRAKEVICVDNAPKMVEFGTELAKKHGIENLRYVLGDIENVPLPDASADLALLSQALHHAIHPQAALAEAERILKPGGLLLVLDLREHQFEKAQQLYADRWLGFADNTLYSWMRDLGLERIDVDMVAREEQEPFFETLLASGVKPNGPTYLNGSTADA
ncbi:MAG: ArsR/SmtB family transcription factor [Opitutales bacterium]